MLCLVLTFLIKKHCCWSKCRMPTKVYLVFRWEPPQTKSCTLKIKLLTFQFIHKYQWAQFMSCWKSLLIFWDCLFDVDKIWCFTSADNVDISDLFRSEYLSIQSRQNLAHTIITWFLESNNIKNSVNRGKHSGHVSCIYIWLSCKNDCQRANHNSVASMNVQTLQNLTGWLALAHGRSVRNICQIVFN